MNIIQELENIELAALGNARLEALKKNDSPELRNILNLALSPDLTYGVKQLPDPRPVLAHEYFLSENEWYTELCNITERLAERQLTGNDARESISYFLGQCDSFIQQKWSKRILKQDLRLNIGIKDVNKVLGEGTIYVFNVPLATDYMKCGPKYFHNKFWVQAKLDGGRCVAILPRKHGTVRFLSRTGKEWDNFESIKTILQKYNDVRNDTNGTIYLDGEMVSMVRGKIDFQSIQKTMHRKDGIETGTLNYIVFDAAKESEWKHPTKNYDDRLAFAKTMIADINHKKIQIIPCFYSVENPSQEYLVATCKESVEKGYEGLILRREDCPVENKRGKKLIKVKMFQDFEAKIIGTVEGNNRLAGTLGAFICVTKDGVQFEVGSGISDEERIEFWPKRKEFVGQIVSVKYFEYTEDLKPRFPIYKGIRHPDDI